MLFISIVLDSRDIISRLRRRSVKIAINARTSRPIFRELSIKILDIPAFINMYNYYMNGVDNTD